MSAHQCLSSAPLTITASLSNTGNGRRCSFGTCIIGTPFRRILRRFECPIDCWYISGVSGGRRERPSVKHILCYKSNKYCYVSISLCHNTMQQYKSDKYTIAV